MKMINLHFFFNLIVVLIIFINFLCTTSLDSTNLVANRNLIDKNNSNYVYQWSNGLSVIWNPGKCNVTEKNEAIDCFGVGKIAAHGLDWLFNKNHSSPLDIRFFLSSRNRPKRVEVLVGKQFGLEWTDFVIERRSVVIVHGFLSHGEEIWIRRMEEAFHLWGDVNVIVVDWSAHGNTWNYYKAAVNAKIVGHQISKFLSHIVNDTRMITPDESTWGLIHMVGHSLGAHICGITADEFKKIPTMWKIERITGLDPAQPCFKDSDSSLDKNDAPFVDVIHTNGHLLSSLGLGLPDPIGHVDFYPNGGKRQPGCLRIQGSTFDYLGIPKKTIQQAICSHGLSYVYFTESIISTAMNNCTFWSHSWDRSYRHAQKIINETCTPNTCTEMGIKSELYRLQGTFFVMTSSTAPYCDISFNERAEIAEQLQSDFTDDYQD